MSRRPLSLIHLVPLLCVGASLPAAFAAAPVRVTVDQKGALRVPAATLKRLGVKMERNGMVCVQFPTPVRKLQGTKIKGPHGEHTHGAVPQQPPRLWTPLRKDGSLFVPRQRMVPNDNYVPGPAGTVYVALVEQGRLVLKQAR
jgi:hypothetical protein